MVWDGNGNYTNTYYPTQDRDSGIPILASKFENFFQSDLPITFGNSITRDGQGLITTDFNANNFKVKNMADGVLDTDAVNKKQLDLVDDKVDDNTTNIGTNTTNISNNTTAIGDIGSETTLFTGSADSGTVILSQDMDNFKTLVFKLSYSTSDTIYWNILVSELKLTTASFQIRASINTSSPRYVLFYYNSDTSLTISSSGGAAVINKIIGVK